MSRRSRTGAVETGFAQSDVAYGAYSGTGVFAGQPPMPDLRALASLYLESVHLRGDAPAPGISERGRPARPARLARRRGLGHAGRRAADPGGLRARAGAICRRSTPRSGRSIDLMTRGRARRACSWSRAIRPAAVSELAPRSAPGWCRSSGRRSSALLQRHRFLTVDVIPADAYPGIERGTPTVGVAALWVVAAALDDELVYADHRRLCGSPRAREPWPPATPRARRSASSNALRGVAIPLHPGAARYYRERGAGRVSLPALRTAARSRRSRSSGLAKTLRRGGGGGRSHLHRAARPDRGAARPQRCRQDHDHRHAAGPARAQRRHDPHPGPADAGSGATGSCRG